MAAAYGAVRLDATGGPTTTRVGRRRAMGAAVIGFAVFVFTAVAWAGAYGVDPIVAVSDLMRGRNPTRLVEFSVDVGCIEKARMDRSPVATFFSHDLVGVEVVTKQVPNCEFGGVTRRCKATPLQQEGFSTVFTGQLRVPRRAEYGFVAVNAAGSRIFELGANKRFPKTGPFANTTCLKKLGTGGGNYLNRKLPKKMTPRADGVFEVKWTYAGCMEKCPLTVKLIATVEPAAGSADNVYGIEESKAATDAWRSYKGHFTMVSAGEYNTWGLDSNTGDLKWTRNVDLNPYSSANWQSASNDATTGGTSYGSVVDMDAGYDSVFAVTSTIDANGGKVWQRNVDGSGDWVPSGHSGSRLVQTTIGRTHLWGVNGANDLWRCAAPCAAGASWVLESEMGQNTKQLEVGDSDVFVVWKDETTLKRKQSDGGGSWATVPLPAALATAKINQVCVGATSVWILDKTGTLYSCQLPCLAGGADIAPVANAPANIMSIDAGKVPHDIGN